MQTKQLINSIEEKQLDQRIIDIYEDEQVLAYQRNRYITAITQFERLYGEQDVELYSAPGRSEIIGNHTDHQHGRVCAAAINLDAIGVVCKSSHIKIQSDDFDIPTIELSQLEYREAEKQTSLALVKGVVARLFELGYQVGGFEAYITSDVLIGAGMSSSAAFEVLIGTILSGLYNQMSIDPVIIAQVGQYAENVYYGKPCGLMDQMASSVGGLVSIDFENKPVIEKINVDFNQFETTLCIVDSLASHANLDEYYADIPCEMKLVANHFEKEYLREVNPSFVLQQFKKLRQTLNNDRALLRSMHYYQEDQRVLALVNALKRNDFDTFKTMIQESGNSSFKYLQNIYIDASKQDISLALQLSEMILGDHGVCRIHGGGFAGTIQVFVENAFVNTYKTKFETIFAPNCVHVLKIRKYGGIKITV